MSTAEPRHLLQLEYEKAAEAYLRSLPPEHFMEATDHARQREITLESLALLHRARPEIQYFNELLVQYPVEGRAQLGQVVPDNMVVLCDHPIKAEGSYNVPLQPSGPYWVLEYVSKASVRKDYEDNFKKYEQELNVPYYLLFYPQTQDLTLYRHTGNKYVTVTPNERGRYPLIELELEVALLDGWVRFWFRGELLPLPADLQRSVEEADRRAAEERRLREEAEERARQTERRAAEERRRAKEQARRAEEEQRRAEEQARLAANERRRAEEQARRAAEERHRAEEERRRAEEERQARLALEQRLAELQAQLGQRGSDPASGG
jgi:Uma2 family endonuclease